MKISNKETKKLHEILNLPEIRSGRFETEMSVGAVSSFKKGISKELREEEFLKFKSQIQELSEVIKKISKQEVKATDDYLIDILNLGEIKILNWAEILRKTEALNKPNPAMLRWSYYSSSHKVKQEPNGAFIERFSNYFEQLRYELILLGTKIKI